MIITKKQKVNKALGTGGFTLIELLVVLAIIGILAGLISTAVMGGMRVAKQTRDVHNMQQVALILMTEAMDNNGVYRAGLTLEEAELSGSTLEVMQGLLNDGMLDDPNILVAEGAQNPTSMTITEKNIGFQYVAGHSSGSPSRLPILFTKGVEVNAENLNSDQIGVGTSAWGSQGIGVSYVGGSAIWLKGKDEGGKMKLAQPLGFGRTQGQLGCL
ncbi:MAG: type II secretion system protein [Blastochloris sp.]|nr:type II secretion system protein [Blastochloris sp.]